MTPWYIIPIARTEFTNCCACSIPPLPALSPLVKGREGRGEGGFGSCAFTNFGSAVGKGLCSEIQTLPPPQPSPSAGKVRRGQHRYTQRGQLPALTYSRGRACRQGERPNHHCSGKPSSDCFNCRQPFSFRSSSSLLPRSTPPRMSPHKGSRQNSPVSQTRLCTRKISLVSGSLT